MSRATRTAAAPDVPQLPLLEAAAVDAQVEIKPTWRGWIHAGTFPVAIAAGIVLIAGDKILLVHSRKYAAAGRGR